MMMKQNHWMTNFKCRCFNQMKVAKIDKAVSFSLVKKQQIIYTELS